MCALQIHVFMYTDDLSDLRTYVNLHVLECEVYGCVQYVYLCEGTSPYSEEQSNSLIITTY